MSLLSMMMSHERKKWICINQSQVSIQAVDQSEASIHLHEHLAAVAGHGGPPWPSCSIRQDITCSPPRPPPPCRGAGRGHYLVTS